MNLKFSILFLCTCLVSQAALAATVTTTNPPGLTGGNVPVAGGTGSGQTSIVDSGLAPPGSAFVGTTDSQTLTNKTLSGAVVNGGVTLNVTGLGGITTGNNISYGSGTNSSQATSWWYSNGSLSGIPLNDTLHGNMSPFTLYMNDSTTPDTVSNPANNFAGTAVELFEDPGWNGTKFASWSKAEVDGAPATDAYSDAAVGHVSVGTGNASMNGSGSSFNSYNGTVTGANDNGYLTNNAKYIKNLASNSMFIQAVTNSSVARKHELELFQDQADAVSGAFADGAILVAKLSGATANWNYLMTCGDYAYACPLTIGSTIFALITPTVGDTTTPAYLYGFDLLNGTCESGGAPFRSPGWSVDCVGDMTALSVNLSGNISASSWTTNGIGLTGSAATYTDQTSTGSVTTEAADALPPSTIAATNSGVTISNLVELYLPTPAAGTHVTATDLYSLLTAGDIKDQGTFIGLAGETITGANIILNGGSSNFNTSINAGTSTGNINIGNSTHPGNTILGGVTTGANADFLCLSATGVVLLQGAACTISSRRFKENIKAFASSALSEIDALMPVTFRLKPTMPANRDPNARSRQLGLLAEDIAKFAPECAIYENDMKTPKSYRQECVIALLVKGMQEQQREIAALTQGQRN